MKEKRKRPEEESSPDYIISKSKQSYFRFRCSFSKTKEEKKAAVVAALKSLGRVKKKPNLSLPILLNLMCRILKSFENPKIRSFRDSTAYIPRYILATIGQHFFWRSISYSILYDKCKKANTSFTKLQILTYQWQTFYKGKLF